MKKTGYLGPQGSYSYLAAEKMREGDEKVPYSSFYLVINALKCGEIDFAVLPIENTLNGGVLQNMDLMQTSEGLVAVQECTVSIDHRLAYRAGADLKKITKIYSHRQALDQCFGYLNEHFPKAELIEATSTAASILKIKSDTDACIIGSHLKSEGLTLSDSNIADEKHNYTHFLLVEKGSIPEDKHSSRVYFSVTCSHRPGALAEMLKILERANLNMTKIESRPIKDRVGEYRFFIELEGDYAADNVKKALAKMVRAVSSFKLLGCY